MKIEITYGSSQISFNMPDEHLPKDQPIISPRKIQITEEMRDIEGSITSALKNPAGSPRLKDIVNGKKVAFTVSDEFRSGQHEKIIKCMLAEIAEGKPNEVLIFCATGSHEPMIYAKNVRAWVEKYAAALNLKYRFIAHDCNSPDHIHIGDCSDGTPVNIIKDFLTCEIRAYGHESKHHYMNGYSCIDKQVLPGLASKKTIEGNHKNALDDKNSFAGRNVWVPDPNRRDNPFSRGCFEARKLADSTFIDKDGNLKMATVPVFGLDMISDKDHVYWCAAGDTSIISSEMTVKADELAAFKVQPTRYVIISPGGPPASQTIYSTQNCFDMALSGAIEDGGEALVVSPCEGRSDVPEDVRGIAPDRKSKDLFYGNLARMKDWPIEKSSKWIDDNFELYLWKTDRVLKLMKRRKIKLYLHSTLPDEKVTAIGFTPVKDIQKWIDDRAKNSPIRIIDNGNKILIMKK